jgi:Ca2+-binding RTX toxin-like protein
MAGKNGRTGVSLGVESLEGREVPAYLAGGNLDIVGTNAADAVRVDDVRVAGVALIRVNHNGAVQYFKPSDVTGRVMFWGYGGNDSFEYHGGKSCYADGGAGNDYLSTDRGNDELLGGGNNDRLWAGGGNDRVFGGAGSDQLVGGAGNDDLVGGSGNDELWGQDGNDRLWGEGGLDFLLGGTGNDYLDGGADGGIAWGEAGSDGFVNLPRAKGFYLTNFVAPYTTSVTGLPGIQDFSAAAGDRRDSVSG